MTLPHFSTQRRGLGVALAALALGLFGPPAGAQTSWPDKPVKVIVPYAAGQGADVLMRLVAQELGKSLNQSFVIDNRAGAGGNIGTAAAAKSPADGYNFLLGTNATNAANEFLYSNLGFNPAADFDNVAMIGLLPMVISTSAPDLPVNGIAELIKLAQAKPNTLNVGLPSTTASVVFAQFVKQANAPLFGVRYKASSQAMTDTLGGQIPLIIDTMTATRPQLAGGKQGMPVADIYAMFPNLEERKHSQGTRLSGGEQQMLAVARILRTGARLLLLDEISEGLAPVIVQGLARMIKTLKASGYTIVMVEQNFRFAAPLADRFYVMEHGQIVETFVASELSAKMPVLTELLGV